MPAALLTDLFDYLDAPPLARIGTCRYLVVLARVRRTDWRP